MYLTSETPLIDGIFGPKDHNLVRFNQAKNAYALWKILHWDKEKRFETRGLPIPTKQRFDLLIT